MKIGDSVRTPRFCTVTIAEVFQSEEEAYENGYIEPTHYRSNDYAVLGKSIDMYHMRFAAAVKA